MIMRSNIEKRLRTLENAPKGCAPEIMRKIAQGAYYDELSDIEKAQYCQYYGTPREVSAEMLIMFFDTLHVTLERKPKPPTPEEHARRIKEIEDYLNGYDPSEVIGF